MATRLSFDELNSLVSTSRSLPFDEYFGAMRISKKQKTDRIKLAELLEEEFIFFFSYVHNAKGIDIDVVTFKNMLADELNGICSKTFGDSDEEFMQSHIQKLCDDVGRTTFEKRITPYTLSKDRAAFIAENEANTLCNRFDFVNASNKCTKKEWLSIIDDRTRETHLDADGMVLPIDQPFNVGDSLMMYPKDTSLGASDEEIINCRCSVIYY